MEDAINFFSFSMPIFQRLPFYKRLQSLQVRQPVQALDIQDDVLRLQLGNVWESVRWDHIKNASILRQTYLRGGITATNNLRRRTSDILTFETPTRNVSMDLSLTTPHFENIDELRKLLFKKLNPHTVVQSLAKRMGQLWVIVVVALIILFLYFQLT